MIRDVLLLDLGNVLVPFDDARGTAAFAEMTGLNSFELKALMTGPKLLEICSGAIHPHDFFDELSRASGRTLDRARASHAWCDIFTPDREMISLAGQLAQKHATYLWSNIDPLHRAFLWPELPCLAHFRGLALSYELGASKPAREFYVRALEEFSIDPKRAVFVDDIAHNLEAASQFGIETILHRTTSETARALAQLGFAP